MEQPETDFCGYSVPHPYEPKMNVRLQTKSIQVPGVQTDSNTPPPSSISILRNGLNDMTVVCDMIETELESALNKYNNK